MTDYHVLSEDELKNIKKVCRCGEERIWMFSKHNRAKDGRQKLCKKCFREEYFSPKKKKYYQVQCEVELCASDAVVRGMCRKHYKQVYTHGFTFESPKRRKRAAREVVEYTPTDGIVWKATLNPVLQEGYWHDEYR